MTKKYEYIAVIIELIKHNIFKGALNITIKKLCKEDGSMAKKAENVRINIPILY